MAKRAEKTETPGIVTPEINVIWGIYGANIAPLSCIPPGGEEDFIDRNALELNRVMNAWDRKRGVLGTINYIAAERMLEDAYCQAVKTFKIKG
jgi:hypothetical protein